MLDKQQILEKYHLKNYEKCSQIDWTMIEDIFEDYRKRVYPEYKVKLEALLKKLNDRKPSLICNVYGRVKDPEHLIAKIIRKIVIDNSYKYMNLTKENYVHKCTDLIGIRVLILKKEDWKIAHDHIISCFKDEIENPVAYICYGDRCVFDEKIIRVDYSNKGYRSQHYIYKEDDAYFEIQVRTLAEEVYGEYDHAIRYPNRRDNRFLLRYSRMVSKEIAALDDMISTSLSLDDESVHMLEQYFQEDMYVDWREKMVQFNTTEEKKTAPGTAVDIFKDNIYRRRRR